MSDEFEYNVRRAAALLGGLSAHGRTPDPNEDAAARRKLATARIDRELRNLARPASSSTTPRLDTWSAYC